MTRNLILGSLNLSIATKQQMPLFTNRRKSVIECLNKIKCALSVSYPPHEYNVARGIRVWVFRKR